MQPKPNTPEHFNPGLEPVADLCAACVHGDNCVLRQMPTSPVHTCSEYDDGTPAALADVGLLAAVSKAPPSATPQRALVPGLCVNCDHRESCTLPRPVGGVWHCEEYQ